MFRLGAGEGMNSGDPHLPSLLALEVGMVTERKQKGGKQSKKEIGKEQPWGVPKVLVST